MEIETYKTLFDKSPKPTLYVVSKKVALANRAAAKLFKRLGLDDPEGADFGKLWPRGTKASVGGLTELKRLNSGEYELTLPDGTELTVETTPLSKKPPARIIVSIEDMTERKRAEEALQESEERYRVMAETALAGIWITDTDENMIFVNPALAKMLGYSEGELVGMNLAQLTDKEGFSTYREGTQLRKKGIRNQYESTLKRKDGTTINVLVSASPLTAADGRYVATLGYVADITERKRAEEALRESEEFNRSVFESSPLGISVRSRTGELLGVNEEWKRIWGISEKRLAEELAKEKGKLEFDKRDEYLGDWLPEVEKVYAEGVYLYIPEVELLVPKEGGACWVSHYFYPIKDPEDKVDRVVILTEDITERKRAEEALQENEERYRVMAETALAGIWITDPDENLIFANPALAEMLGYSEGELVGMNIAQLTDKEGFVKYREGTRLRKEGVRDQYESTLKHKDGTIMNVLVSASPLTAADGSYEATLGYVTDITERKRTEEKLIASQEYTRNIISSSPDMIVSVDNDRRIVEFNEAAENAFGYSKEEVLGKHIDMLYADLEESKRIGEAIRKTGKYVGEITNVRKNGEAFTSNLSASLLCDSGGEIVGVMGVSRDITIDKKATEALRESQQRFATLVEAALEGIGIVDTEENFIYMNTAFAETLGYSVEEIIEMDISQLVSADQFDAILAETEKRRRGETSTYEVEFIHRDGSPVYFVVSVSPMFGRDGVYEGAYAVFLDITERKRAEEALRASEERHRALLDTMNDGFGIQDEDGVITYVNDRFCDMFGYSREELIGRHTTELMLDDENEEILIEQTAKREKEKGEYYELSWKSKEGKDIHTMVSPAAILDPGGNFIGTSGVITDITDRKMAEEALRESEERYRAFTEEAIVGVYIYRDGRFHFVNKEMEEITGYSRGELLEISTDELVSPEDREHLAEREKLRKRGDELPARYSLRIKRKDGEPAVLMVGSRPIQYGGETAYLGNCIDITENVKAQEALKSEKEKAQQYLDIAGVMFIVIGPDHKVRMINKKGCELLGCAEEEIIGKNWFTNFVPKEVSADIKSRFEKLMAGEKEPEEYFENPVLTKNGEEPVILWHNTVLRDGTGEVNGILSSGEDITERKLAEEALSKSEREKSAILENMSEFVVYIDKEMRIIWANKAVADSLESAPDDLAGHKCYEMWFGRDRVCDDCHALTVFETGERVKRERTLSDGRIWDITYDPVRDDSGEIVGAVEVSSDITERKRAEAVLRDTLTKLQKSLHGTISTISKIVETRDPYTSGHQTRVAELARSIAAKMGLPEERIELIYMAALVHDIGKISVPQEILSKPTELTELEWNIIRTHPEVGCEILKNVEFPWPVTDVVIQHHERLDGSGYPHGIGADDIMLEARILSVADVVEAMSSHRPYRPELGMHKALEEISDNKGVLYDDEAVNVCVNLFKRDGFSFSQTV